MLDFRILGPVEVVEGDQPLLLGGRQQRALLAVLLLRRNEVVSSDRLMDALWGERAPPTAATTVRVYVSNLRKVLGREALITRSGGYLLAVKPGQVDADRFDALLAEGRVALADDEPAKARDLVDRALRLWRGEPLADLAYAPFAQGEIARLVEARVSAIEDRIDAELMLGQHRAASAELEALVSEHPHRERLLGQLMLALYRSGRQADALAVYRAGRRALTEELGLEPGPQLRALEQQILDHDPGLEPPEARTPAPAMVTRRARGRALVAVGAALLLAAAVAAVIVNLAGGAAAVRAAADTVAAIDVSTDRVVGAAAVGARPGAIAFGAGSLWVANRNDQTVSRVDPASLRAVRTISLADTPTGIAGTSGGVWVASSNPTGTFVSVGRIDPQFDEIDRTIRVGNVVPGSPAAIAGHGAALWVAPFSGELTRIDVGSGQVLRQIDPNAAPTAVDFDAAATWVSDRAAGTVTRIDPTGLTTPIAVGHDPSAIAVGDGAVWVADTGDNAVVRIDPDTRAVTATIPVGAAPTGIALGAGSVWVADGGDGTVTRISAGSDKVTAIIPVGGSPQAITVADGRAWVTVDAPTLPAVGAPAGGTLRVDAPTDVTSMDPALADDRLSSQLLYATCAHLVNYPDKAGQAGSQLIPEVAQSLPRRSRDGRTYTFTIRPGFRFSPPSDAPVTAATFRYTIERTLSPRMRSPFAADMRDIVGAAAYMAGKSSHIAGITANANTLTIRLIAPQPDLPARLANPAFCAVPTNTPFDPAGVRVIPSAGPYRVDSYAPGQGVELIRNPNYHGPRPHAFTRIAVTVGIPSPRAISQTEAGTADYAAGEVSRPAAAALSARYGPGSLAAKRGHQEYFVNPLLQLDMLELNTHRPLFSDLRIRQAVNYAIDRTALARLGDEYSPLPERPTDAYIPPGMPGYNNPRVYPLTPDLTRARQLARGHRAATAVLYTCDVSPCAQQAQIVKTDLAAIGIRVQVHAFPDATLYTKVATPGEPFDLAWEGWIPDWHDPYAWLSFLLRSGRPGPPLGDPIARGRLAAGTRLTGAERYLAAAKLDSDLLRNAAPLVAFGNLSSQDLFSARIGCQAYGVYGIDLAALCLRPTRS